MRIQIHNKDKVTLREYLNAAGFNWKTGTIVYQETRVGYPGLAGDFSLEKPTIITPYDKVLDKEFNPSDRFPMFPRIFAKDEEAIYIPAFHNRYCWLEKIETNWTYYTSGNNTPYVGDSG